MGKVSAKFRQFGKTTMLAELAMLDFYREVDRVAKRKTRTLRDVVRSRKHFSGRV